MKLLIALFTLLPLLFIGIGTYQVYDQHCKITTFQPVRATVMDTRIEQRTSRDSDGRTQTTYKPVVKYRYEVNGRSYTAQSVTPIGLSAGRAWAQRIIDRYPKGTTTTAYYNPENPGEAFLLRQYSFFPYVFVLFPMLFLAAAALMSVQSRTSLRRPARPRLRTAGWFEIKPLLPIATRFRTALIVAVVWHGVGVLAWGHYFTVAGRPYELFAIIATAVYEALGMIPAGFAAYYYFLGRNVRDAGLRLNAETFVLGRPITAKVELPVRKGLYLEQLSLALICDRTTRTRRANKTTITTQACYEDRTTVLEQQQAHAGETLAGTATLSVPADQPPSSPPRQKAYPRYAWRIEVHARIADSPDYRGRFPIIVRDPSGQESS